MEKEYQAPMAAGPPDERKPLWKVMYQADAWCTQIDDYRESIGPLIRAVRDWLVPEERTLDPIWFGTVVEYEYNCRQRLRAQLTAEADRAERGDG